ncbi:MAG TPA: tetratricopeptide repeat protein, partial [Candidatus Omnitrophota bacterium]|nr:tetratricopeptide repeat protein [Candidatus Omnitrophota bacterium]
MKTACHVKIAAGTVLLMFLCVAVHAAVDNDSVDDVYNLMKKRDYEKASKINADLLKKNKNSDILNFNMGIINYASEKYDDAVKCFRKALATDSKDLERDALQGIGNSLYRLSEKTEEKDIKRSIEYCNEAFEYFSNAVEIDSKNTALKYNLEATGIRLAMLKEKDNPPQNSGSGNGQGGGSGSQGNGSQQQGDQNQNNQQNQQGGQGQQDQQKQQSGQGKDSQQKGEEKSGQDQQQGEQGQGDQQKQQGGQGQQDQQKQQSGQGKDSQQK